MIDSTFLNRWCRTAATLVTVTASTTERDEMNRPVDVETTDRVLVCIHPEQGVETTTGRQVSTGRQVVYMKPCAATPAATSKLTVDTITYEFDEPPLEWTHPKTLQRIGWEGRLVRSS